MMKSPTSLIRFRNAVGVMLALSAIFAVVISAVTFTQDRALAEHGADTHVDGDHHRWIAANPLKKTWLGGDVRLP